MILQQNHLQAETKQKLDRWAGAAGCRLLVLFGSAAGPADAPRDVDLALSFTDLPAPERRLRIIGELQDLCGASPVDVVFLHRDTDPVLRFEIFRSGTPIHESRPALFVEEAVRALALYEDALPFRRALRESLKRGEAEA
jgi:predicted nucleotidyltransferase